MMNKTSNCITSAAVAARLGMGVNTAKARSTTGVAYARYTTRAICSPINFITLRSLAGTSTTILPTNPNVKIRSMSSSASAWSEQREGGSSTKDEEARRQRERRNRSSRNGEEGEFIPIYSYIKRTIIFAPLGAVIAWWVYKTWNPYPRKARFHLRSALLLHRYQNAPQDAVEHYRLAIDACTENDYLPEDCLAVVGIKVLLAEALESVGDEESDREAAVLYSQLASLYLMHKDVYKATSMAVRCGQLLHQNLGLPNTAEHFYEFALGAMLKQPTAKLPVLKTRTRDGAEEGKLEFSKRSLVYSSKDETTKSTTKSVVSDGSNFKESDPNPPPLTVDSEKLASWVSARDLGATLFSLGALIADKGNHEAALALYFQALSAIDHDKPDEFQSARDLVCQRAILFNSIATSMDSVGRGDLALTWASKALGYAQHAQRNAEKEIKEQLAAQKKKNESGKLSRTFSAITDVVTGKAGTSKSKQVYNVNDNGVEGEWVSSEEGFNITPVMKMKGSPADTDFVQDIENSKFINSKATSSLGSLDFLLPKGYSNYFGFNKNSKPVNGSSTTTTPAEASVLALQTQLNKQRAQENERQLRQDTTCTQCEITSLINFADILKEVRSLDREELQKKGKEVNPKNATVDQLPIDFAIVDRYSNIDPKSLYKIAYNKSVALKWELGKEIAARGIQE